MNQLHRIVLFFFLVLIVTEAPSQHQKKVSWKKVRILVYTKNGEGYVHDNIPNAIAAIRKLAADKGFQIDVSEDPAVFKEENLKQDTSRQGEALSVFIRSSGPKGIGSGLK
jgi:hypothetical protein